VNSKAIFRSLKDSYTEWDEDKASRMAAALAYYTTFSLGPLLIILIAVAGLVFGPEAAQGQIVGKIDGLVGRQSAQAIQIVIDAANRPSSGVVATVIGIATLILGAAGAFAQLQDALNTIWEVQPKPGRGLMGTVKVRLLPFMMVLGVGFLMLVSLLISAGLVAVVSFFGKVTGIGSAELMLQAAGFLLSFGAMTLLFAMIYKVLPDATVKWRDVWLGAAFTALLLAVGTLAIGLYLGNAGIGSAYGAAGSLVVLLLWIYYWAQLLLFGAEFTHVRAKRHGAHVVPTKGAVLVTEEERAEQGIPHGEGERPGEGSGGNRLDGPEVDTRRTNVSPSSTRSGLLLASAVVGLAILGIGGISRGRSRRSRADVD